MIDIGKALSSLIASWESCKYLERMRRKGNYSVVLCSIPCDSPFRVCFSLCAVLLAIFQIFPFFSLQFNSTDCPSPDARSLTGPDILHRHSINSLLERHELINRGLSSPIEGM